MPASLSDKTVLLTGSEGFTGRYVAEALTRKGAKIIPLKTDLRDREGILRELADHTIDYVIHLAAISFVPHGTDMDVYAVNLFGTQNLLEALKQTSSSVQKVILASSANIYGNTAVSSIDETLCPAPLNHYAISKMAMEHMAAQYAGHFAVLFTRPFNYTGVGQAKHFLIPKIVAHFAEKAPQIELGNIDVSRDFSDVRWIAEAYCGLLSSPLRQGTFNLCSASAWSIREIIGILESISGHTLQIVQNPAFMRSGEIAYLRGNSDRLYAAVPDLESPIGIENTLEWMYKGSLNR